MDNDHPDYDEHDEVSYESWDKVDFSIITMGMKKLPFFKDDLYLGMQAMNVGIVDSVITEHEYALLREWFEIERMPNDEPLNLTVDVRKRQLLRYKDDEAYRTKIDEAWMRIEPVYRMTELFRMNLAKHCAPGKDGVVPRAPGYGRINRWCGALDYELIEKDGYYSILNRRNIADALRAVVKED